MATRPDRNDDCADVSRRFISKLLIYWLPNLASNHAPNGLTGRKGAQRTASKPAKLVTSFAARLRGHVPSDATAQSAPRLRRGGALGLVYRRSESTFGDAGCGQPPDQHARGLPRRQA